MHKQTTRQLTFAALLAAVYALLTVSLPIPQFGGVQIRFAEALTVLPFLIPGATPGLAVGCFLANLFSPYPLDVVFGARMPSRWLAPLPPVVCNALIVGFEVAWSEVGFTAALLPAYALNMFTVGLGELCACYLLGLPLLSALSRVPLIQQLAPEDRLARLS